MEYSGEVTTVELQGTTTESRAEGTTILFTWSTNEANDGKLYGVGDAEVTPSTEIVIPESTFELTFLGTKEAFYFTESVTTEVAIAGYHTHVTIGTLETAIEMAGTTTTVTVTGSTAVIVDLPAETTSVILAGQTLVFTAETIASKGAAYNGEACGEGSTCYVATTINTVIEGSQLFLIVPGKTEAFTLEGITTTFVPEQS